VAYKCFIEDLVDGFTIVNGTMGLADQARFAPLLEMNWTRETSIEKRGAELIASATAA